jgi:hypothetical protein
MARYQGLGTDREPIRQTLFGSRPLEEPVRRPFIIAGLPAGVDTADLALMKELMEKGKRKVGPAGRKFESFGK